MFVNSIINIFNNYIFLLLNQSSGNLSYLNKIENMCGFTSCNFSHSPHRKRFMFKENAEKEYVEISSTPSLFELQR